MPLKVTLLRTMYQSKILAQKRYKRKICRNKLINITIKQNLHDEMPAQMEWGRATIII